MQLVPQTIKPLPLPKFLVSLSLSVFISCSKLIFLFPAARNIQETTPTFLSPSGISSSKMVLRGEELLLECIAAGV